MSEETEPSRLRAGRRVRASTLVATALVLALVAFASWYRGDREPVSAQEIDAFDRRVAALDAPTRAFFEKGDLRAFLTADDGEPFYAVNVFRLRDQATRLAGQDGDRTGAEAMAEFSRRVVPLFARHGGHPVFATSAGTGADLVTVVRYRSRRDWMTIATSERFLAALPYRLAATEENIRLTLPGTEIPHPVLVVALLCAALVCISHVLERVFDRRGSRRSAEAVTPGS